MSLAEFLLARIAEDEDRARQSWWPARQLIECEAKRRIIAEHEMTTIRPGHVEGYWWDAYCRRCTMGGEYTDITKGPREDPCATLRILGAIYADHPDYREEWRP